MPDRKWKKDINNNGFSSRRHCVGPEGSIRDREERLDDVEDVASFRTSYRWVSNFIFIHSFSRLIIPTWWKNFWHLSYPSLFSCILATLMSSLGLIGRLASNWVLQIIGSYHLVRKLVALEVFHCLPCLPEKFVNANFTYFVVSPPRSTVYFECLSLRPFTLICRIHSCDG